MAQNKTPGNTNGLNGGGRRNGQPNLPSGNNMLDQINDGLGGALSQIITGEPNKKLTDLANVSNNENQIVSTLSSVTSIKEIISNSNIPGEISKIQTAIGNILSSINSISEKTTNVGENQSKLIAGGNTAWQENRLIVAFDVNGTNLETIEEALEKITNGKIIENAKALSEPITAIQAALTAISQISLPDPLTEKDANTIGNEILDLFDSLSQLQTINIGDIDSVESKLKSLEKPLTAINEVIKRSGIASNSNAIGNLNGIGQFMTGIGNILTSVSHDFDEKSLNKVLRIANNGLPSLIDSILKSTSNTTRAQLTDASQLIYIISNIFSALTSVTDIGLKKRLRMSLNVKFIKKFIMSDITDLMNMVNEKATEIRDDASSNVRVLNGFFDLVTKISEMDMKGKYVKMLANMNIIRHFITDDILQLLNDISKVAALSEEQTKQIAVISNVIDSVLSVVDVSLYKMHWMLAKSRLLTRIARNLINGITIKDFDANKNKEMVNAISQTVSSLSEVLMLIPKKKEIADYLLRIGGLQGIIIATAALAKNENTDDYISSISDFIQKLKKDIVSKITPSMATKITNLATCVDSLYDISKKINKIDFKIKSVDLMAAAITKIAAIPGNIKLTDEDIDKLDKLSKSMKNFISINLYIAGAIAIGAAVVKYAKFKDIAMFIGVSAAMTVGIIGLITLVHKIPQKEGTTIPILRADMLGIAGLVAISALSIAVAASVEQKYGAHALAGAGIIVATVGLLMVFTGLLAKSRGNIILGLGSMLSISVLAVVMAGVIGTLSDIASTTDMGKLWQTVGVMGTIIIGFAGIAIGLGAIASAGVGGVLLAAGLASIFLLGYIAKDMANTIKTISEMDVLSDDKADKFKSTISQFYSIADMIADSALDAKRLRKIQKAAKEARLVSSTIGSIAHAIKSYASLKIPVYSGKDIVEYKTLSKNDFKEAGSNIRTILVTVNSAIEKAYNGNEKLFNPNLVGSTPAKRIIRAFKRVGPMLSSIATAVCTYASLNIPLYNNGKDIVGYRHLDKTDFIKAGNNISDIITTLFTSIDKIGSNKLFDPDKYKIDLIGIIKVPGRSPFSRIVHAYKKIGPMISEMAEGIVAFASMKIPEYDNAGNIIGYTNALDETTFASLKNNIVTIIEAIPNAIFSSTLSNEGHHKRNIRRMKRIEKIIKRSGDMMKEVVAGIKDVIDLGILDSFSNGKSEKLTNIASMIGILTDGIIAVYYEKDGNGKPTKKVKHIFKANGINILNSIEKAVAGTGKMISSVITPLNELKKGTPDVNSLHKFIDLLIGTGTGNNGLIVDICDRITDFADNGKYTNKKFNKAVTTVRSITDVISTLIHSMSNILKNSDELKDHITETKDMLGTVITSLFSIFSDDTLSSIANNKGIFAGQGKKGKGKSVFDSAIGSVMGVADGISGMIDALIAFGNGEIETTDEEGNVKKLKIDDQLIGNMTDKISTFITKMLNDISSKLNVILSGDNGKSIKNIIKDGDNNQVTMAMETVISMAVLINDTAAALDVLAPKENESGITDRLGYGKTWLSTALDDIADIITNSVEPIQAISIAYTTGGYKTNISTASAAARSIMGMSASITDMVTALNDIEQIKDNTVILSNIDSLCDISGKLVSLFAYTKDSNITTFLSTGKSFTDIITNSSSTGLYDKIMNIDDITIEKGKEIYENVDSIVKSINSVSPGNSNEILNTVNALYKLFDKFYKTDDKSPSKVLEEMGNIMRALTMKIDEVSDIMSKSDSIQNNRNKALQNALNNIKSIMGSPLHVDVTQTLANGDEMINYENHEGYSNDNVQKTGDGYNGGIDDNNAPSSITADISSSKSSDMPYMTPWLNNNDSHSGAKN